MMKALSLTIQELWGNVKVDMGQKTAYTLPSLHARAEKNWKPALSKESRWNHQKPPISTQARI